MSGFQECSADDILAGRTMKPDNSAPSSMTITSQFPREEMGTTPNSPTFFPRPFSVTLADGEVVCLKRFHQEETYAGMLAGLPHDPQGYVLAALRKARAWDEEFHDNPIVIPSLIRMGIKSRHITTNTGVKQQFLSWEYLPPVLSFAEFRANAPQGSSFVYASALVLWWQDEFGLPADPRTLLALQNMAWTKHASLWDP